MGLAAALVCSGAAAAASLAHATGPPPAHTGGFDEPTCLECHIGNDLNAFGGTVRIEGLPERYESGSPYTLTVLLRADETESAGYQLSARFADGMQYGLNAGTLQAIDSRSRVTLAESGTAYVHQTPEGSSVSDPSGSSWTLVWTAPSEADAVVFHVAANSGNGDNSPLSDLVFTHEVRIGGAPGPTR